MNKIPKIIHYCWFGEGKKNEKIEQCIESWKKKLPDYKIIEWNEKNFDINSNLYTKEAYEAKKWAFITDYVRLYVLYNYGGIYLDTDVEVLKPLDNFLINKGFSGFEDEQYIPTGIMGSIKKHEWIEELLKFYENKKFKEGESYDLTPNTETITRITQNKYNIILNNKKQEIVDGFIIYPKEYFCPKNHYNGEIRITSNTYTIHHFNGSWQETAKLLGKLKKKLHICIIFIFGEKIHQKLLKRIKDFKNANKKF